MDLNLDTLKTELLEHLESAGYAVFHSTPGALEGLPLVLWDVEHFPDYQMFLDVARKSGAQIMIFATAEFEGDEIDELIEQLEEGGFTRDEQREYTNRLRDFRIYAGVTCTLEVAFDHNQRFYVFDVQPDWYEEYLGLEDEITSRLADDDAEDDSLGGYFSKN